MYDATQMITAPFAAKIGITQLHQALLEFFTIEDAAYKLIIGYKQTGDVNDLNKQRMVPYRNIMNVVKANLTSSIATTRNAAIQLSYTLKPYHKADTKGFTERSALLTNMGEDLNKLENMAHITKLALTDELISMIELNEASKAVFIARADAKEQREAQEKMTQIRPFVDEAYRDVVLMINSAYLVNEHAATPDPSLRLQLTGVMEAVNARVLELNALIHARESRESHQERPVGVHGTSKAVVITHLSRGLKYKVMDIADRIVAEGISSGERTEISVPVGEYTVFLDGEAWEKTIVVK